VIPPRHDAAFAAAMEDVLAVYARPVDPARPVVCFDEAGKELTAHTRPPLPPSPGQPAREDSEYARGGQANLFLACAPHLGWRQIRVTARRAGVDFAHALRALVDQTFPAAERIVLVLDNLNTHRPAALYQAFPPAEARRILERIEWHFTPVHGSWLNLAELEWSVLSRQCLARRIPDAATLETEVASWVAARNQLRARVAWRFTVTDARVKLAHVYPIPEPDSGALTHYETPLPTRPSCLAVTLRAPPSHFPTSRLPDSRLRVHSGTISSDAARPACRQTRSRAARLDRAWNDADNCAAIDAPSPGPASRGAPGDMRPPLRRQ
jgi:hypothetical protein